jgi:hypothetical protein
VSDQVCISKTYLTSRREILHLVVDRRACWAQAAMLDHSYARMSFLLGPCVSLFENSDLLWLLGSLVQT